jgi:glycosyltransferase involved in cell wall biosynthesis
MRLPVEREQMTLQTGIGRTLASNASESSGSSIVNHRTDVELSVVIPCLNEAQTLAGCVEKAQRAIRENGIAGEVVVADNGSSDDSREIAERMGARVVAVAARGYGNALMGGIGAAHGKFIIMGDADGSYDFEAIPVFLGKLREGFDLVQGCRLKSGGGTIRPGAMPLLHQRFGNPFFSLVAKRWFNSEIHDVYCGLRGFSKAHFERLEQRCTGMEFATEMIVKSCLFGARIAEVPITLHPDGRSRAPHLRTFRDGWRTLRLFLVCSPRQLFLVPGVFLIALGLLAYFLAMPGLQIGAMHFDAHTLLFGSLAILCGYQAIFFGIFAKALAAREGILPEDPYVRRILASVSLEVGLIVATAALLLGLTLLLLAFNQWRLAHFGSLQYAHTMRLVVPGLTLTALGFQTILSAFLLSILDLGRRGPEWLSRSNPV